MNGIKRMTIAVKASLDRVLTQVENHEAVTQTALEDLRRHLARARAHSARVKRDGEALAEELTRAQRAEHAWRERAVGSEERGAALECVRRSREAAAQVQRLSTRLSEHKQVTSRLGKQIRELEERYGELHSKKRVLQARDAEARALELTQGGAYEIGGDVESLLERWELTIDERCHHGPAVEEDDFELGYVASEERASLEAELAKLRGEA